MGTARIHWRGAEIREKLRAASELAVDRTMSECIDHAKREHPWRNRTGFLEASIWLMEPAHTAGATVAGRWGSDANYALFLEIGTSREGPTAEERALATSGNLNDVAPPQPVDDPLMAPRPYLRPAADSEYPLLRVRIGQGFRGEQLL